VVVKGARFNFFEAKRSFRFCSFCIARSPRFAL
jgi:hypothetical protein